MAAGFFGQQHLVVDPHVQHAKYFWDSWILQRRSHSFCSISLTYGAPNCQDASVGS